MTPRHLNDESDIRSSGRKGRSNKAFAF